MLPTLSSVNGVELAVHLPAFLLGCPILVALITLSINFTVETNTSHGSPCGRVHTEAGWVHESFGLDVCMRLTSRSP